MRKLHERILELGGDSTWMHLPEMGIRGNTHAMMQDDNSRQIADLVCDWLVKKAPAAANKLISLLFWYFWAKDRRSCSAGPLPVCVGPISSPPMMAGALRPSLVILCQTPS